MRVRRLGQSAFHLTAGSTSVLIDPFDDIQEEGDRLLLDGAAFETDDLPSRDGPVAVVPRP